MDGTIHSQILDGCDGIVRGLQPVRSERNRPDRFARSGRYRSGLENASGKYESERATLLHDVDTVNAQGPFRPDWESLQKI